MQFGQMTMNAETEVDRSGGNVTRKSRLHAYDLKPIGTELLRFTWLGSFRQKNLIFILIALRGPEYQPNVWPQCNDAQFAIEN